jgi:hypothetical protein
MGGLTVALNESVGRYVTFQGTTKSKDALGLARSLALTHATQDGLLNAAGELAGLNW